ncbi:glycosyltransferase [Mesorhizobium sp. KR9-304]|uniref:glycosyltransferase n=1 Tax=Mesorhizobium sp. KR9-304 TaxID=3156614 RepID=UPI0032B5ADA2
MLMQDLGYRAPHPSEETEVCARFGEKALPAEMPEAIGLIPAAVLHADPLISYSGCRQDAPLGLASVAGRPLRDRAAWFLISPTWTIEGEDRARELRQLAMLHRARNPGHRLIFACNTQEESDGLRAFGEAAFLHSHNAHVPEWIFKPLDGVAVEFDAVYNAQLVPWKRHELSLGIESCAFLFHRGATLPTAAATEAAIIARHTAAVPGHVFINRFDAHGKPARLSPSEVNTQLNRARVGLCLSEKEGAMFASMEYLLAGLPVVSTPSIGGRDVYFDEEYCLVVPPDPRSIAEAVQALKVRGIPRTHIRERTLKRLENDRARFIGLLNAILEESGSDSRFSMPWPFAKPVTMEWLAVDEAVHRAAHGIVDGFEKKNKRRGFLLWRKWWPRLRARYGRARVVPKA